MRRTSLHIVIGIGRTIGIAGGRLAQAGVEIEHWGMQHLLDSGHSVYQSNDEINGESGSNGGSYRLTFLR